MLRMSVRMCPQCKQQVTTAQQKVEETVIRTPGFEQVGGVAYDGLTSMCSVITEHMDIQRGQGQIGGENRLAGAQDLAWALINSPAFLFNR